MARTLNLDAESGANIIDDDATPVLELESTGAATALKLKRTMAGNATVAALELGTSVASGAVLSLTNSSFVSCTSILFTTGGVAGTGVVRVVLTDGTFGWLPVLPDSAVTTAPVE